ncbi:hypothetical protein EDF31_101276 [Curtobacterium sp. PhB142]|uniref:hypothetical protein n=1 Tax=unclassified Curtobacterium TaxID=257496 RepID=UPI0010E68DD6|nr:MULTISPECIES: hypothetical protein [unclassified Curtobacterium]TCL88436.1 hypothetical protein EDF31_101276 [Curtobacterium sp. PhB142]TCM04201.1 hypothetical protein EDF26_102418 [Curtobacterium sp. PhB134]TCU50270.1 hypothetical protein EDF33_101771 [Curtobacterium sp. PhB146]
MDDTARQALTDEWVARGRSIAAFVAANVPPEVVPVAVFDHSHTERSEQTGDTNVDDGARS